MSKQGKHSSSNISSIFLSTAIAMVITEISGVLTSLIDGVVSSRFLDIAIYSSISLLKPLSRIISVVSGFLSTGCNIVWSRLVGTGEKEDANATFNLCILIGLLFSGLILLICFFTPNLMFSLCGITLNKYPELIPHLRDYLRGFMIGIPVHMICQVSGPILVMDNGKKSFTISSMVLAIVDICAGLANVFIFHGGAFGMGLAASLAYIAQFIVLLPLLLNRKRYFHLAFVKLKYALLPPVVRNGTPAFTKRLAVTLRDTFINYFNLILAMNAIAIAAKGIQNDLFSFFFCIAVGFGRTLITMVGIYHGSQDREGLIILYSYAMKTGILFTGVVSLFTLIFAPALSGLYTNDPEALSLTIFSIRCMASSMIFDTITCLCQYYFQGIGDMKRANILTMLERFIIPVACAVVMGLLYGSKGILASIAIGKFLLFFLMLIFNIIDLKRFPKSWEDIMYLPVDFGQGKIDNIYARMEDINDVIAISEKTRDFCLEHGSDNKHAQLMSLFVEEIGVNVFEHAQKAHSKRSGIDFRLMINEDYIRFYMSDLGELFDPTSFYELHQSDSAQEHIGIRLVMKAAKEVRYYSTFNANNLIVTIDR